MDAYRTLQLFLYTTLTKEVDSVPPISYVDLLWLLVILLAAAAEARDREFANFVLRIFVTASAGKTSNTASAMPQQQHQLHPTQQQLTPQLTQSKLQQQSSQFELFRDIDVVLQSLLTIPIDDWRAWAVGTVRSSIKKLFFSSSSSLTHSYSSPSSPAGSAPSSTSSSSLNESLVLQKLTAALESSLELSSNVGDRLLAVLSDPNFATLHQLV